MREDGNDKHLIEELRELEEFRRLYQRRHPAVEMERDDPDVRRLIEALAFFSLRTRVASLERQQALWRRLFASYFPFLLEPLPMMAIAQAQWSPRLTDPVELQRGTELRAERPSGRAVAFQTLGSLRVVPVELKDVTQIELTTGTRLVLSFVSRFQRNDAVKTLHLYPDYGGGYAGALTLWYELRCNLQRASVIYDAPVSSKSEGAECRVRFGAYTDDLDEPPREPDPNNQLFRARSFFHFPQQELYLNIAVPPSARPWTRFHLCFDLGPQWPRDLRLDPFTLRPFTVPIANQRRAAAMPIVVDGTRESFPVLHPQAEQGFRMLSLRGVYRLDDRGVAPLLPLALAAGQPEAGFEVEEPVSLLGDPRAGGHPRLRVQQPHALLDPITVTVDALWHQPEAQRELVEPPRLSLPYRSIDGLSWQTLGPPRPSAVSALGSDVAALLHLLALRMKPDLDLHGLLAVLAALTPREGFYSGSAQRIRALAVRPVPDSTLRLSGIRHQYSLSLDRHAPEDEAAVWTFLNKVHLVLDAWNSDAVVELAADTRGSPLRLPFGEDA